MAERRRGAALEDALLDAAWAELTETGYANLTMEAVAARAHTSRPVIYRRWSDKADLLRAAMQHILERHRPPVPDTGSLRGDILALMHEINRTRVGLMTAMSVQVAEYYEATGTSPSDLRKLLATEQPGALDIIFDRAARRGEFDPARVTNRIRSLPFDLLRQEMLMHRQAATDATISEIVDTIFLPLTRTPTNGAPPQ
ncbi:TetR/AcrR family transcriptional regulator [Rhodococcus sp. NPDC058521]|uniref:TetR/AcrR family transcriptional regulator n=1 Tax=Rhodococcus sp. NPDC058521 TaxID=3346536 RepID=UPI003663C126